MTPGGPPRWPARPAARRSCRWCWRPPPAPPRRWRTMSSGATASRSYDLPVRIVDRLIATSLPVVPRPLVRHFADRYIAGETLGDAVSTVAALNGIGAAATVDVLGEFVHDVAQCQATADEYVELLDAIAGEGLDANVSIKLSALGAEIDPQLALEHTRRVVLAAAGYGSRVRIDMEHSGLTDQTIGVYRTLRDEGHDNVGIVLQAYLRRTSGDVRALADLAPSVRLVKGIYIEPPDIAYTEPALVNRNFLALLRDLVDRGWAVAVASHDYELVGEARRRAGGCSQSRLRAGGGGSTAGRRAAPAARPLRVPATARREGATPRRADRG